MEPFYSKKNAVQAVVDAELSAIIVTWKNLANPTTVRECCLAQVQHVSKGAKTIVVDTSDAMGVPPPEVQDWFGETLFPQLADAGCKAIITVVAASATTRLASQRWTTTGEPFAFDMFEVDSLETARELAKRYL